MAAEGDGGQAFKLWLRCDSLSCVAEVATSLRRANHLGDQHLCDFGVGEPELVAALRTALSFGVLSGPFKSKQECISEYWDAINASRSTSADEYACGMRCRELAPAIWHVEFAHQLLMASTMLRLQERYECPCAELRGRGFTLAEYKAWERKSDPARGFTYYDRWPGFNVPGSIVLAGLEQEASLVPREVALKSVLGNALSLTVFYVIGTTADHSGSESLYHEVCHAMYEVNAEYQIDVDEALFVIPDCRMRAMKAWLRCNGYPDVDRILDDEVHAYLSEGDTLGCQKSQTTPHTKRLREVFVEHAGSLSYLLDSLPALDE